MNQEHNVEAVVDRGLCIGNGVCVALAPYAFALDDNHKAVVLDSAGEPVETLLEAARACPVQAIYLSQRGRPIYP